MEENQAGSKKPKKSLSWWLWLLGGGGLSILEIVSLALGLIILIGAFINNGLELYSNYKNSGGCSLTDSAFRDTSTITAADQALAKLQPKYRPNKARLQQIIDASIGANVNPAILIAFWGAEQSFRNDHKAFGYKDTKNGGWLKGFDDQMAGALRQINFAITEGTNSAGVDYSQPEGENIWTRLMYHYDESHTAFFNKYEYLSPTYDNRIKFLKLLVPEQVQCEEVANIEYDVNSNVPYIFQIGSWHCERASTAMLIAWATNHKTIFNTLSNPPFYSGWDEIATLNKYTGQYNGKWVRSAGKAGWDKRWNIIDESLKKGRPVMIYHGWSTKVGHVVVIAGYNAQTKKYIINDPVKSRKIIYKTKEEIFAWGGHKTAGYKFVYIKD